MISDVRTIEGKEGEWIFSQLMQPIVDPALGVEFQCILSPIGSITMHY